MCQMCEMAKEVAAQPNLLTAIAGHFFAITLILYAFITITFPKKAKQLYTKLVKYVHKIDQRR